METRKNVGLSITTYEIQDGEYIPTITHVFWGKDLNRAIEVAKAHLITDYFFSYSFEGEMPWGKDNVLILENTGRLVGKIQRSNVKNILNQLAKDAHDINDRKVAIGLVDDIQSFVNM